MSPKELRDQMAKCIEEMDALHGKIADLQKADEPDAEAVKKAQESYEAKKAEFDGLQVQAKELKERAARVAATKEVEDLASRTAAGATIPDGAPAVARNPNAEALAHAKAFYKYVRQSSKTPDPNLNLSDGERELLVPKTAALREGEAAGSVRIPTHLIGRMFGKTAQQAFGVMPSPWGIEGKAADPLAVLSTDSAAGSGSGSGAAQLVAPDYRAVLQQMPFDVPSVFDKVLLIPSRGGTITWPTLVQSDSDELGGVAVSWIDEGAPKPATRPVFSQKQITTHEVAAYSEIGDRMLKRSAIDLEALLVMLFGAALKRAFDIVIMSGTGTGQPLGILNTTGIRTVARQTANAVDYVDLTGLKHAIKAAHRGGCSYTLEDSVEEFLENAVDLQNRPLFRASMANGPYDRLNGYMYQIGTNSPTLGTTGDVMFGNLRYYFFAMEEEITVAKSEHYKFQDNVTAFKTFAVVGGRLMQPRAVAVLDDVASS